MPKHLTDNSSHCYLCLLDNLVWISCNCNKQVLNSWVLSLFLLFSPEEESSSSSSDEDEDDRKQSDELLGKVVCVDCFSVDKKKALWFPALVRVSSLL